MHKIKQLTISLMFSSWFMVNFIHAQQVEEIHIGNKMYIGYKQDLAEHFFYEKNADKKIFLVTRLSKDDIQYELLNYEGGRNYKVVRVRGEIREGILDFKVYDGPNHWLADIEVTDKQIIIATVTPDTTYSVFRFVKKDSDFERKMYAVISFPPGLRSKNDGPKLQSLSLSKLLELTASFDKGKPIVYSFPEGESEVHVNGRKPERSAGSIYWFDNE